MARIPTDQREHESTRPGPDFGTVTGRLTPAARAALERTLVSRRTFLRDSGVLLVGFSLAGAATPDAARTWATDLAGPPQPEQAGTAGALDAWLAIGADGRVTVYTGKCELGQGILTVQAQLVAEELDVPLEHVAIVQCDTAQTPDQGTTSGSQSHPANFNRSNLALAAATARRTLAQLAAERLGVVPEEIVLERGIARAAAEPARQVGYGDLVGGRRLGVTLDPEAARKPKASWTVLGRPVPRLDGPALVTGTFEYVHHVRVPGMLHGAVVRPPAVGAAVESIDETSVKDLAGVVAVVRRQNFVGVVAETPWVARAAAARLRVSWTRGSALPAQAILYEYLRGLPSRDTRLVDSGDVDAAFGRATRVLRATYRHPYQLHASMAPSCAVADVSGGRATVWSATQAVWPLRATLAKLLDLPQKNVRVIFRMGAGCYGLNGADTVTYDAALLSQAVGRPVRVQLTRRDEMGWENFGAAAVMDERAALGPDGTILAWDYDVWIAARGGRPGYETPGNVVTGALAGFEPAPFVPRRPAPEPATPFDNGANAAPNYVSGCVGGVCGGTGTVRSERVLVHTVESPFWTGPLRSPARLQNTFAHECFMDELAAAAGADPVAYRRRHLRDARLIEVLDAAARTAGWQPRSSPNPQSGSGRRRPGRGAACVLYEGDNGYAALVAEVEVDEPSGIVAVKRLVVAHECGPISNPDGLRNQIEGGLLQGLSRALGETATWDAERVTSVDWHSYRVLPLGIEVPAVEIVLIDRPDGPAMGAGETAITLVAAAVGNAIFDATGARIREVPFTPSRIVDALAARR